MKMKVLITTLVLAILLLSSVAGGSSSENVVASLDGKSVTVETLKVYVDEVAGSNYEPWLNDRAGLRKLADFYINRTLLLEHAKKTVAKGDSLVTNHNARVADEDVMYLTSLLKSEVKDKVHVSDDDVHAYMARRRIASEKQARQNLETDQKNALMAALVEKVREGHEIQYYD